jgi:hypothetical protein
MERIKQFLNSNDQFNGPINYLCPFFVWIISQLGWIATVVAIVGAVYYAATQRNKKKISDLNLKILQMKYKKECKGDE